MRQFLQDSLDDLRDRRLLPVAVLLALAIVAAPVLLMRHAAAPTPAPPTAAPPQLKPLTALASLDKVRKPPLRALSAKDPFGGRHVPKLTSLADAAALAGAKGGSTEGSGSAGGSGSSGGGGSTSAPTGGVTQPAPTYGYRPPASTKRVAYTFQADVAFGDPQRPRERRGLKRFAMLPDSTAPLLVFLGVDSSESNAVFLVDASLSQSGEGRCGDAACSFIELGPGNEHMFRDTQGHDYLLRVDQIRKVRVRPHARASRRAHASASSPARPGTHAQGAATQGRRFVSPLFGDRIEQSVQR
ncbi:MAG: hypothetical protein ABR581_09765 [Thermoleophilaceae bacterium]